MKPFGPATFNAETIIIGVPKRFPDALARSAEFVPSHHALLLAPPPAMDAFIEEV